MKKTLGGSLFIRNGLEYDYCFEESIKCLLDFCDKVVVVDAGSDDGTTEILKNINNHKLLVIYLSKEEWLNRHGKEKLTYFTDKAIDELDTDYNFYLQADEILHESSYKWVRTAMEVGGEGYLCTRNNLWGNCNLQLNVPHERKPCSTSVLRLAKTRYKAYGDAESLNAPCINDFEEKIKIWHYGFVRKKEVMRAKIINMQIGVFGMSDYDPKLDECNIFNPKLWFDGDDLEKITEPHPKIMKNWILTRP